MVGDFIAIELVGLGAFHHHPSTPHRSSPVPCAVYRPVVPLVLLPCAVFRHVLHLLLLPCAVFRHVVHLFVLPCAVRIGVLRDDTPRRAAHIGV